MPFVKVGVETEKEIFNAGTKAGQWGFWINDIFGNLVAGPKVTPNESTNFRVKEGTFNGEQLVAFAVRLDRDGNRLGLRRFKLFRFDEFDNVVINEVEFGNENEFIGNIHPILFGSETLPVNNEMKC